MQAAYLHKPSGALLVGDLAYHVTEASDVPELTRMPKGAVLAA